MKHFALFIILLLASCANPAVISNPPSGFTITEFAPDGSRRAVHQTSQYIESGFPSIVQFRDVRGNPVKIRGSYLIEQQ
jgi:hypothetical protein